MRKIIPSVLIALIIVNLFAPFSVEVNKGVPNIRESKAEAYTSNTVIKVKATPNSLALNLTLTRSTSQNHNLLLVVSDKPGVKVNSVITGGAELIYLGGHKNPQKDEYYVELTKLVEMDAAEGLKPEQVFAVPPQSVNTFNKVDVTGGKSVPCLDPSESDCIEKTVDLDPITGLKSDTPYYLSWWGFNGDKVSGIFQGVNKTIKTTASGEDNSQTFTSGNSQYNAVDLKNKMDEACKAAGEKPNDADLKKACDDARQAYTDSLNEITQQDGGGGLPECLYWFGLSMSGCIADLIYALIFKPTSALFSLAGQFFDFTFFYSVKDTSYSNAFVVEGWGIVRDFVNLFFIFVLLWIAFSTILDIHGFKTKDAIVKVVIIGLLINFSLFATQVIIDTSNILARVFYNSTSTTEKGQTEEATATNGEKQLSAAIVGKVNPQQLIIGARNANLAYQDKNGVSDNVDSNTGVTNGTFILITLLASVVNVVGMIVFLMSGLLFVARVIGLWIAMILVPFAFFSYMVPGLQDIDMLGWKKWWPNTLKLAFMAPIFIFFLYLVIKFLSADSFVHVDPGSNGPEFIIATIVPFAFIIILLNTAKKFAAKFAGDIGSAVTKAAVGVGGVALGGAALGTAFLGRNVIGGTIARASRGDTLTQKYERGEKMGFVGRNLGAFGSKIGLGKVFGKDEGKVDPKTGKALGVSTGLGGLLNKKQRKVGEVDHARHEMDEAKKKAGLEGVHDNNLSGVDKQKIREEFIKSKKTEIESDVRKGAKETPLVDANNDPIKDNKGNIITGGESGFKAAKRQEFTEQMKKDDPDSLAVGPDGRETGELTDEAKKKIEDKLNVEFNVVLKNSVDNAAKSKYEHTEHESKEKVGGFSRAIANSNKSTYDPRNISQMKSDHRESIFTKMPIALMAGIALAVRAGLKQGININHGTGQGDMLKDLGNTLKEALKHMKVDVKVDSDGHGHGKASTGGGGGGGGHH